MRTMRIGFAALVIGVLVACSPSGGELSGDVFIVTRGGENYKLGLVTVSAIPADALRAHTALKVREVEKGVSELQPEISALTERVVKRSERLVEGSESESVIKLREQMDALTERLRYYESWAPLLDDLPPAIAAAKTDADGKFTMALPKNGTFGIVARGSREVGDKTETYFWIVQVSLEGQASKRMMLSNDNLLTELLRPASR